MILRQSNKRLSKDRVLMDLFKTAETYAGDPLLQTRARWNPCFFAEAERVPQKYQTECAPNYYNLTKTYHKCHDDETDVCSEGTEKRAESRDACYMGEEGSFATQRDVNFRPGNIG